eukprot:scaffold36421_cov39-Phaeocystis_antarctica.AAC.1
MQMPSRIPQMSSTIPLITSPQIPQIPQSSADLADYSAVCASSFSLDENADSAGGEVRVGSKIDPISYCFFGILGGRLAIGRSRSKVDLCWWGFGNSRSSSPDLPVVLYWSVESRRPVTSPPPMDTGKQPGVLAHVACSSGYGERLI